MKKKKLKNFWPINELLKNNKYWLLKLDRNLRKLKILKYSFKNQNRYLNKVKLIQNNLKSFSKSQLIKSHFQINLLIKEIQRTHQCLEIQRTFQFLELSQNKLDLIQLMNLLTLNNLNFEIQ